MVSNLPIPKFYENPLLTFGLSHTRARTHARTHTHSEREKHAKTQPLSTCGGCKRQLFSAMMYCIECCQCCVWLPAGDLPASLPWRPRRRHDCRMSRNQPAAQCPPTNHSSTPNNKTQQAPVSPALRGDRSHGRKPVGATPLFLPTMYA